MPQIYITFLWHMHQPLYKDLVTGEYRLPWTRMHALKDYYGMVKVLDEFPDIHQTFNVVPSLALQIDDYAKGTASDPFLRVALKPAEELTKAERLFVLDYFFQANESRLIRRYPRYAELFDIWNSYDRNAARVLTQFNDQALRDLQVLSQLAWFDEEFLAGDSAVQALVTKERHYTLEDQQLIGRKEREICGKVLPVYREFAERGQIELSTSPFYHPVLPLLCNSDIAEVSHPYVPLPSQFEYPQDARYQMASAIAFMRQHFGVTPKGLWPPEGCVSDETFAIASDLGFTWAASDNGVLARTLEQEATPDITYRPYVWQRDEHRLGCVFRDHFLSDLIGFVYSRMGAAEAAEHFVAQIREKCAPLMDSDRDLIVPVILDGENAWEYYEQNGREFLRELYGRISAEPAMEALTTSEALERVQPQPLDHIWPGSWINATFDVWIGAEEDNRAWELLREARITYDRVHSSEEWKTLPEDRKQLAWEELMIAEGSDWCWWYGPEHESANRIEFDQLYREHLVNVYLALNLTPPESLSRPIVKVAPEEFHHPQSGPIKPTIDGLVTNYFEWLGAGIYRVDSRSGAMHGQRFFIQELHYGSDGRNLFLRLDFTDRARSELVDPELHITMQRAGSDDNALCLALPLTHSTEQAEAVMDQVAEVKVPLGPLGFGVGSPLRIQLSLWQNKLPLHALPGQGWISVQPT